MNRPDVSFIIINYNTFDLTMQCIYSILEKIREVSYEIILVDNASPENRADEFKRQFPQIILIKSDTNLGFAKGNNLGIAAAQGNYILLLNSDTVLKNDVPKILLEFLKSHPNVAAVSARLEYPDGTTQHNCQRFPSVRFKLFELLRLQKIFRQAGGKILFGSFFKHDQVAFPDWIWGTCFMFHNAILNKLPEKKLADTFFMYGEDIQWCMEFRKIGYRVGFEPTARLIHYLGKSGGTSHVLIEKNMKHFMLQYYAAWHVRLIKVIDYLLNKL